MRLLNIYIFLVSLAFVGLARAQCTGWTVAEWDPLYKPKTWATWDFGANEGGGKTLYSWRLINRLGSNAEIRTYRNDNSLLSDAIATINQAPIVGGKNSTNDVKVFTPTASITCLSNTTVMWGPSYPDALRSDFDIRSSHPNLEVYILFSVPTETSYVRTIYFIKNTAATPDRVRLFTYTNSEYFPNDISPADNGQRYYTAWQYEANDAGDGSELGFFYPGSVHVRGQKSLDKTATVFGNPYDQSISTSYTTVLGPGEQFAFMHITSVGNNTSAALKNAAEIDAEPPYIFHNLTSDQLAMIRNWGGCQVIIGPTATVTVTPPTQCSSGLTSDFTVQASSSRNDLTTGFTHRVVGIQNIELVAAQSSTTLSVPNGAGAVSHQLWYKQCLVKETAFTACTTTA